MRQDDSSTALPGGGTITYTRDEHFADGMLTIDLPVDPPAPRAHLLNAASARRPHYPGMLLELDVDKVATCHLQNATGTRAHITDDATRIRVRVFPPTPLLQRPPRYGGTPPYLDPSDRNPLTPAQEAMLHDAATAIGEIVPSELRPHATDLARLVAQNIPAQADVLRAYQRTSVTEVIEDHDLPDTPTRPTLLVANATFRPASGADAGHTSVELTITQDPTPETPGRIAAAHEILDGGALHIDASIDRVATRHLHNHSATTARITDGGYTTAITTNLPASTPADSTTPAGAGSGKPALTAEQQAHLPALTDAISSCLPDANDQQLVPALARDVARQIPSRAELIESFDAMTLAEIIDDHEETMEANARALLPHDADIRREAELIQPALQAFSAVRLAQLSFPHHPATALQTPHNAAPAAGARTPSAHPPGPSLDR